MNVSIGRRLLKSLATSPLLTSKRHCEFTFKFDADCENEITESHFRNVFLIGINLPERENVLNDSALVKLNHSLKHFDENDDYSAAVLHGVGGSLCKGVDESVDRENCDRVIKTLGEMRKPTLACIAGHTIHFGFQLAVMCDLRFMEETAVLALAHKTVTEEMHPLVCERLVAIAGLAVALDVALAGGSMNVSEAIQAGFVAGRVACGSGLGKCVNTALGITKFPLAHVLKRRSEVFRAYESLRSKTDERHRR